jgi:hypothetical protein
MPRRETEVDRVNGRIIADAFLPVLKCDSWFELPDLSATDFALRSAHRWVGLLEAKRRYVHSEAYDSYTMSVDKWQRMVAAGKEVDAPVFYALHFADCALWTVVMDDPGLKVVKSGRNDRGQATGWQDTMYVPRDWFRPFSLWGHGIVRGSSTGRALGN